MIEHGNHKRVWEYDGAFKCLDCQSKWGALPNALPAPPIACVHKREERRFGKPDRRSDKDAP